MRMSIREQIIRNGNVNRIMEMHEEDCGVHQISGVFRDHGIRISASDVAVVIRVHEPLGSKALPKSAAKAAIKQKKAGLGDAAPITT